MLVVLRVDVFYPDISQKPFQMSKENCADSIQVTHHKSMVKLYVIFLAFKLSIIVNLSFFKLFLKLFLDLCAI